MNDAQLHTPVVADIDNLGILVTDPLRLFRGADLVDLALLMTVDFVVPRVRKGKNEQRNLVAACRPCNVLKGNRVFASFEEAKAYLLKRRADLHMEWEARMAQLRARNRATAQASRG
jgi:hypothetical protein